jgi:hypothetical protein
MVQRCDFSNISTRQRRVLDFKLEISTGESARPDLVLNTANIDFQPEKWYKEDMGRRNGTFANPLVLEPNEFAEGIVEFAMSAEEAVKYHNIINYQLVKMQENSVFHVIERLSELTRKTKLNEHYDARTDAVWRAGCPASLPRGENGVC